MSDEIPQQKREECSRTLFGKLYSKPNVNFPAFITWSYSTNLLVLKQCLPEVPEHCYDFTKAEFWVRIGGVPPLKSGAILDIGNNWLWVEFKYERLPHYCFSCGRIGHYATDCLEIPYATSPVPSNPPRGTNSSAREPASIAAKVQDRGKQVLCPATSPILTDDIELLETPVQLIQDGQEWALVASPNKPPLCPCIY